MVVAEDIGPEDVAALTRRLRDAVAQPLPGTGAVLGVSIGVAVLDGDSGDAESVLQLADRQMYAAKERARADKSPAARCVWWGHPLRRRPVASRPMCGGTSAA